MNMHFSYYFFRPGLFSINQRMFRFWYFECYFLSLVHHIVLRSNVSPLSEVSIKLRLLNHLSISHWTSRLKFRSNESIEYLIPLLSIDSHWRLVFSSVTVARPIHLRNFSPVEFYIFTSSTANLLRHSFSRVIYHKVRSNDLSL